VDDVATSETNLGDPLHLAPPSLAVEFLEAVQFADRTAYSYPLNVRDFTKYLEEHPNIVFEPPDGLTIRVQRTEAVAAADSGPLERGVRRVSHFKFGLLTCK
jgi:hypothetical protein